MQAKIEYLTAKLQEEAAEVIQAVSKIRRFGDDNTHPQRTTTNKQEFVTELEDFLAIVAALESLEYIDLTLSHNNIRNKAIELLKSTN